MKNSNVVPQPEGRDFPVFSEMGRPIQRRVLAPSLTPQQPLSARHLRVRLRGAELSLPLEMTEQRPLIVIVEGILCAVVNVRIDPVHGLVLDGVTA
jgi:hypothetical protein